MTLTAKCKTKDCDKEVEYEQQRVDGGTFSRQTDAAEKRLSSNKVVYLTCDNDHTNRYVVSDGKLS